MLLHFARMHLDQPNGSSHISGLPGLLNTFGVSVCPETLAMIMGGGTGRGGGEEDLVPPVSKLEGIIPASVSAYFAFSWKSYQHNFQFYVFRKIVLIPMGNTFSLVGSFGRRFLCPPTPQNFVTPLMERVSDYPVLILYVLGSVQWSKPNTFRNQRF